MKLAECHPQRKHQARGMCKPCYDKWLKETNPVYKSDQRSNTTKWILANPDRAKVIQDRRKQKEKDNPEIRRSRMLLKNYGLTLEDYARMLDTLNGGCKLCNRKPGKIPLHVDHNHTTGRVRGLLCHQCNWYVGTIDADPTILNRIEEYIK